MLERYVTAALFKNDYSGLKAVGMDETSKRKGHDYITLFVDLFKKRTLFIAGGKDHKTVEAFVDEVKAHHGSVEAIMDIRGDMSPAFIKGVEDNLPNASITFDRFHIMKMINKAVDAVRKQEAQTQALLLKGTKYLFLKNEENLTDAQRQKREGLSMRPMNLKSIKALHIREHFQEIYKAETFALFESMLKKWYFWATPSRLEPMIKSARTIQEHFYYNFQREETGLQWCQQGMPY